jgi:predicted RND superfamily exporter protein
MRVAAWRKPGPTRKRGTFSRMTEHPIVRLRWAVLAAFLGVCAWLIPGVTELQNDDDVLAFLPAEHPDVIAFQEVAKRFGMLEVALIGLSDGEADLLTPERMDQVRALTKDLATVDGVNIVLSAADLPNPIVNDEGLEVAPLVPEQLRDAEAIRKRVLENPTAVGNFVSRDGKATAILVFLHPREGKGPEVFAKRRATLDALRSKTQAGWKGERHLTGAPFIEMSASESSRGDIERLSPLVIAVLAIASALLLGSLTAAVLNLLVTGIGVGLIMGAHGVFGEPLTIVSSSTPVMMVALGGAFGVHMLAGYQRQTGTPRERASATLRELWLPVLLSGCTTSVAFFSLYVMPQVPMQRFGVVAGVGVLLLLVLALFVMPAMLSVLPASLIKTREERAFPLPFRPPLLLLLALAVGGSLMGTSMRADPDAVNVFPPDSEPRQAMGFFDAHFGGSTFLQVAVEGSLADNETLRIIRDVSEELGQLEGVVDVRNIMDAMGVVNGALGGREGIPETQGRAARVLTYVTGHPAMRQLMTDDGEASLIHVKLAPMSGDRQHEVTDAAREILARYARPGGYVVAKTTRSEVATARAADIKGRLERALGRPVDLTKLQSGEVPATPAFLEEIAKLRDEALDPEEGAVAVAVPPEEMAHLPAESLVKPRGKELEELLRTKLPTLAAQDAEGVGFAAEHLGAWIDEAAGKYQADAGCVLLELGDRCDELKASLAELGDEMWIAPPGIEAGEGERKIEVRMVLTGQPPIGQAFAESVTTSLWRSTGVSILALAVVLLLSRTLFALLPAIWTLAFTAGIIALLGHSISVGTSMVSCIALGAGVDFAIHLGFRARQYEGPEAGQRAVDELGSVVLISAIQLALAFCVLGFSELLPLQHFGVGLAVGLVGAALGAVWFTPALARGSKRS